MTINRNQLSTTEPTPSQEAKPDSTLTVTVEHPSSTLNIDNINTSSNFLVNGLVKMPIARWPGEFQNDLTTESQYNVVSHDKNVQEATSKNIIEEYEEEWAYEDESNSSEFVEDGEDFDKEEMSNVLTTPTLEISSSVEALIDGIEGFRLDNHKQDPIKVKRILSLLQV